jgi:hypothetical protein
MPDIDILHELQKFLEWVDQPPSSQGRDTHVIRFLLQEQTPGVTTPAQYRGLMVFRPRNTFQGPVAQMPGLTATGTIANKDVAQVEPAWVRLEVFFRPRPLAPADVVVTLRFMRDNADGVGPGSGLPGTDVRFLETDAKLILNRPAISIAAPPERWELTDLKRTTLLFGPPPP